MERKRVSKLLSLVLRHEPERFGVHLDDHGWTDIGELLARLTVHGTPLTREQLIDIATPRGDEKHRFEVAGARIRARYGHSVAVDYDDTPEQPPPAVLYHGTPRHNVEAIRREGLAPMGRRAVHLSEDVPSARQVGARRGTPVVLTIDAAAMAEAGAVFHRLPGGVWLTDRVPPDAIIGQVPSDG